MTNNIYYNKEDLEKYFIENYPINWHTWLSDALCSFDKDYAAKMNKYSFNMEGSNE